MAIRAEDVPYKDFIALWRKQEFEWQAARGEMQAAMVRYFEVRSSYRRAKKPRPGEAHGFNIIATY